MWKIFWDKFGVINGVGPLEAVGLPGRGLGLGPFWPNPLSSNPSPPNKLNDVILFRE